MELIIFAIAITLAPVDSADLASWFDPAVETRAEAEFNAVMDLGPGIHITETGRVIEVLPAKTPAQYYGERGTANVIVEQPDGNTNYSRVPITMDPQLRRRLDSM